MPELEQHLEAEFGLELPVAEWLEADESLHEEPLRAKVLGRTVAEVSFSHPFARFDISDTRHPLVLR